MGLEVLGAILLTRQSNDWCTLQQRRQCGSKVGGRVSMPCGSWSAAV